MRLSGTIHEYIARKEGKERGWGMRGGGGRGWEKKQSGQERT
jgi:hypothetical protein